MAFCIPDRIPSRASRGEKRTYNLLKILPDDYIVYHEPNINGLHPDFIVIAPDLGVIVIEVKGWYFENIIGGNNQKITVDIDGLEREETHPLEQAREYMWELVKKCNKNPNRSLLLNNEGEYRNRIFFPFCHFAVLSNISRYNIARKKNRNYSEIFKSENTLFKDELIALKNASPEEIKESLIRFFHPFWKIPSFTSQQIVLLRSIIDPEIILSYIPSKPLILREAEQYFDLKVLDLRQENNACRIGEGHRIIYGVAGSGKTVLLIARAKMLHQQDPEMKILLLCYNVALSAYLKEMLKEYPRVHVFHFDGWAIHNGITRKAIDSSHHNLEDDISLGNRLLDHLRQQTGDYRTYNAILVDEAQDFPPVWFSCVLEALDDPFDGDLLIVCDGNQGIRLIDAVSWKSLGIKAAGRTIHQAFDLDRNYRNTREILKLASHFTMKNAKSNDDSISIVPVDPSQAIRRGPKPVLFRCSDHADECQKVITTVKQFIEGKVTFNNQPVNPMLPHEIGILYPRKPWKENDIFTKFLEDLSSVAPVTWLNEDRKSRSKVFERSIKVQTVPSSKGLQYRAVIIMWADLFEPRTPADSDHEQRLLYVALTRASDVLVMTYSKENKFIERMVASGDAVGK